MFINFLYLPPSVGEMTLELANTPLYKLSGIGSFEHYRFTKSLGISNILEMMAFCDSQVHTHNLQFVPQSPREAWAFRLGSNLSEGSDLTQLTRSFVIWFAEQNKGSLEYFVGFCNSPVLSENLFLLRYQDGYVLNKSEKLNKRPGSWLFKKKDLQRFIDAAVSDDLVFPLFEDLKFSVVPVKKILPSAEDPRVKPLLEQVKKFVAQASSDMFVYRAIEELKLPMMSDKLVAPSADSKIVKAFLEDQSEPVSAYLFKNGYKHISVHGVDSAVLAGLGVASEIAEVRLVVVGGDIACNLNALYANSPCDVVGHIRCVYCLDDAYFEADLTDRKS